MSNKYLYMVVGAIVIAIWFYTGQTAYYGSATGMSDDWWYGAMLAIGLGAGSTGGVCAGTIFVESIKGYISTLIILAIVPLVGYCFYSLAFMQTMPVPEELGKVVISIVVSGFLTNMALSYLRKANA
ncbi:MAG: hypothetical protein K9G26_06575 [Emcibacter sp.]|nr:hypothetical protein [Emcibacter sp.]